MVRSSSWVSWLAILAAGLLVSSPAFACKCMFPPVEVAREDATAVFEGRVLSIEDVHPDGSPESVLGERSITLTVVRTWKGLEREERVTVYTNGSSAACGYSFAKDTSYLVYARASGDPKLYVSSCSRTKPLADAAEDLKFLGVGSTPVHIDTKAIKADASTSSPDTRADARAPKPRAAKKKGCSVGPANATEDDGSVWLLALPALALLVRLRRRSTRTVTART